MSDQQILLDLLPKIKAIPKEQIKSCDMPIGIYVNEAEGLYNHATADLPKLMAVGMPTKLLEIILPYTRALRTAQSNWEELTSDRKQVKKFWKAEAPAFFQFRRDLIDHMEFAYRNDEDVLKKLDAINEGDSNADAIQDMANLAVLGKANPEPLRAIKFDLTLLDIAASDADRMAGVLGAVNGQMYVDDDSKVIRDKAFTLLKGVVDEIRNYGRFVFRNEPDHLRSYSSKYCRDKSSAYRRKQAEQSLE